MRTLSFAIACGLACLALRTTALAESAPGTLSGLENMSAVYTSESSRTKGAAAEARDAIVRDAGLGAGVRGGYAARSSEIAGTIAARQPELDRIFNFGPFVTEGRMLVPAIEEVEDVSALKSGTLRESKAVYRIIEAARMVTVAPTWRDYIVIHADTPPRPDDTVLPRDGEEREVWKRAVSRGWEFGRKQADAVFHTQLELLVQAYTDRLRYRDLQAQRMVAPAEMGAMDAGIVREDAQLRVGDVFYSVSKAAKFAEPAAWRAIAHDAEPVIRPAPARADEPQIKPAVSAEPVIRPATMPAEPQIKPAGSAAQ